MRLFVAFELPAEHLVSIAGCVDQLANQLPGPRWVPSENWHCTVKFIGSFDEAALTSLDTALSAVASEVGPIESALTEVGAFPSMRRAKVIWVGLADATGELTALAERIDRSVAELGVDSESRPFTPHVTVARSRSPIQLDTEVVREASTRLDRETFVVTEFVLFQSHTGPKGARYEKLGVFSLSAGL